ncbi:MAG: S-layer homology domain-containing protein [Clostridia bacterium]|nr:S-layer homology domain-containing protein [Clostridia bacterium]
MIKKILISMAAACVLTAGISASAATVTSVVVSDYNTSEVTVEGTIGANEKIISLYFEKQADFGGTGLTSGAIDASNVIIQPVYESKINRTTGKFTATFIFTGNGSYNGNAGVKYDVTASNQTTPHEFMFVDKATTNSFIADVAAGTAGDVYSQLNATYGATVGIDTAYFATEDANSIFTAAEKQTYLNDVMAAYKSEIQECLNGSGTPDEKAVAAANKTKELAALAQAELSFLDALKDSLVASNVHAALTTYGTSARIAGMDTYLALADDTARLQVCTNFIGDEYKSMTTFETDFGNALVAPGTPGTPQGGTVSGNVPGNVPGNTSQVVIPSQGSGMNTTGAALTNKYNDIGTVEWAYDAIDYVVKKGIMQGTADKTFAPNEPVLREQVAKIITVAFNRYNSAAPSNYNDVNKGHWAYSYIGSAMESGLMNGMSDGSFGIGQKMTRQDLCTVIYRAVKNMGYNLNAKDDSFSDFDSVSDYAKDAVAYLAGAGIISGMGDETVAPNSTATRAQTAQMLMKVSKLLGIN